MVIRLIGRTLCAVRDSVACGRGASMVDIGSPINRAAFIQRSSPRPARSAATFDQGGTQNLDTGSDKRPQGSPVLLQQGPARGKLPTVQLTRGAQNALLGSNEALLMARAFNQGQLANLARERLAVFGRELAARLGAEANSTDTFVDRLLLSSGDLDKRLANLADQAGVAGFTIRETVYSLKIEEVSLEIRDEASRTQVSLNQISLNLEIRSVSTRLIAQDPINLDFGGIDLAAVSSDDPARLVEALQNQFGERRVAANARGDRIDILPNQVIFAGKVDPADPELGTAGQPLPRFDLRT